MKKQLSFICLFLFLAVSAVNAQLKEKDNLLGGSLGFWSRANTPMFGVNFESNVTQAGIGTVGLGGVLKYYTFSTAYSNGDSRRYSFTSVGFQTNYNFNQIGDGSFVPFVGAVVGYNFVNNSYTDVTGNGVFVSDVTYSSGAWIWGQTGLRYFFSPNVAGLFRIGFGNNDFNTIDLGIDLKL